jgi:RNA polymerase sigma-70 factor (ECF subfamily)
LLTDLLAALRAALPELSPPGAGFLVEVARRLPPDQVPDFDPWRALGRLHLNDLYVAHECIRHEPRAIRLFESAYFAAVDDVVAELRLQAPQADEVKQVLWERLFMPSKTGRPPALVTYSGQGPLRAWIRVSAVREAYRILDAQKKWQQLEGDRLARVASVEDDPELQYLKGRYREEFRAAFAAGMADLDARQRNVLRHYHLDGMTIDQIGALYRVHRATAFRWLERARKTVLRSTRKALCEQLNVSRREVASIMRLIESRLDVSVRGHFSVDE